MAARVIQKAWRGVQARAQKEEEAEGATYSSAACQDAIKWPLRPQNLIVYQQIGAGGFGKVFYAPTSVLLFFLRLVRSEIYKNF